MPTGEDITTISQSVLSIVRSQTKLEFLIENLIKKRKELAVTTQSLFMYNAYTRAIVFTLDELNKYRDAQNWQNVDNMPIFKMRIATDTARHAIYYLEQSLIIRFREYHTSTCDVQICDEMREILKGYLMSIRLKEVLSTFSTYLNRETLLVL